MLCQSFHSFHTKFIDKNIANFIVWCAIVYFDNFSLASSFIRHNLSLFRLPKRNCVQIILLILFIGRWRHDTRKEVFNIKCRDSKMNYVMIVIQTHFTSFISNSIEYLLKYILCNLFLLNSFPFTYDNSQKYR